MVITFITPFGIHVQEKYVVAGETVEDTTPSCTTNLVSVKKDDIIVSHLRTWEDF